MWNVRDLLLALLFTLRTHAEVVLSRADLSVLWDWLMAEWWINMILTLLVIGAIFLFIGMIEILSEIRKLRRRDPF